MHNEAIKMAKWAMADACAKGYDNMNSQDWDDFKDCVETAKNAIKCDYYYRLVECMKKDEEEDKREDKYFFDMLKEEYSDDYKRMKEEYGEEEADRRFYDNYRYKSSGRFAPKGRGSYMPRRGYDEPPHYHMTPEMMREHDPEYWRDVDRKEGRMYYTEPVRMDGMKHEESRYDKAKRGYEETKAMHKGNTPEDKQITMREAEKMLNVVFDEIDEMLEDATPEMKNMVKAKGMTRFQKIS